MRSTVSFVVLAALVAGLFIAHGVAGGASVAEAAETILVESTNGGTGTPSTAGTASSDTRGTGNTEEVVRQAGIAATPEQRLAVADRWGLARINVSPAWDTAGTFAPVLVAVLDTGIDPEAACASRVRAAIDFSGEGSTVDEHGHGTHMMDTIAAIAPNASFLNVKVADRRGRCETGTVANAIRWAADRGADVINVSLEVAASPELEAAVRHAWSKGAIVVAAAGNNGSTEPAFPAAYEEAIAVAASNEQDGLAVLSNHGDWIDIAAPGFRIYAEALDGNYDVETGTSPAAAHVSGVAALLYGIAEDSNDNGMVNDEVREALETSARPLDIAGTGSGLVDACAAVQLLLA